MTILDGDGGSGTALQTPPTGIPMPHLAAVSASSSQPEAPTGMRVRKRNGALEPVDVNKIVNAIAKAAEGLRGVDPMRVATRTISALADGATTRQLDDLSIRTAAGLIVEEYRARRKSGSPPPLSEYKERFPVQYPELQPFFLEGRDIYNVPSPGGATIIHTRTIVDPRFGAKLVGKVGRASLSVRLSG